MAREIAGLGAEQLAGGAGEALLARDGEER